MNRTHLPACLLVLFLSSGCGGSEPAAVMNLIDLFGTADTRSTRPLEEAFDVVEVTIDGETRRAIFAHASSRIIWTLTLPHDAWLRTWLALKPEAWTADGDGVLFRVGVSDGRTYDELLFQHLNPAGSVGDRRWMPVTIDLSPYALQQIDLIFNTNSSLPGMGDDDRNDLALWGEPEIFVRR